MQTDDEAHADILKNLKLNWTIAITKKMENSIIISGSKGKMIIRETMVHLIKKLF